MAISTTIGIDCRTCWGGRAQVLAIEYPIAIIIHRLRVAVKEIDRWCDAKACHPSELLGHASGIDKHESEVHIRADCPRTNVLVHCCGIVEHALESGGPGNIPTADVLIESRGTTEHVGKVSHLRNGPATDVLVKSIVV